MPKRNGFTLIELMVVVGIIGIILAIAIPYYVAYKRTACDRSATEDLSKIKVCLERIGIELVDLNCSYYDVQMSNLDLSWLIGPYYGWAGTTRKCNVRVTRSTDGLEMRSCAFEGSRPGGQTSRYIYRQTLIGGVDLPALTGDCTGSEFGGRTALCYTSSMVNTATCAVQEPAGSVPCGQLVEP